MPSIPHTTLSPLAPQTTPSAPPTPASALDTSSGVYTVLALLAVAFCVISIAVCVTHGRRRRRRSIWVVDNVEAQHPTGDLKSNDGLRHAFFASMASTGRSPSTPTADEIMCSGSEKTHTGLAGLPLPAVHGANKRYRTIRHSVVCRVIGDLPWAVDAGKIAPVHSGPSPAGANARVDIEAPAAPASEERALSSPISPPVGLLPTPSSPELPSPSNPSLGYPECVRRHLPAFHEHFKRDDAAARPAFLAAAPKLVAACSSVVVPPEVPAIVIQPFIEQLPEDVCPDSPSSMYSQDNEQSGGPPESPCSIGSPATPALDPSSPGSPDNIESAIGSPRDGPPTPDVDPAALGGPLVMSSPSTAQLASPVSFYFPHHSSLEERDYLQVPPASWNAPRLEEEEEQRWSVSNVSGKTFSLGDPPGKRWRRGRRGSSSSEPGRRGGVGGQDGQGSMGLGFTVRAASAPSSPSAPSRRSSRPPPVPSRGTLKDLYDFGEAQDRRLLEILDRDLRRQARSRAVSFPRLHAAGEKSASSADCDVENDDKPGNAILHGNSNTNGDKDNAQGDLFSAQRDNSNDVGEDSDVSDLMFHELADFLAGTAGVQLPSSPDMGFEAADPDTSLVLG
ncbi:uncharacterized protein BXZ73DRAFT_98451 [Epithele typhae]|uniref:uncharacterized protein n=1 Tax=Epithele typhae TaxID=378194 RepID=UPI002008C4CC|nr:uncharacterized protein BXZ73DRAFT_98451 [Epithele typhae]KAH9941237.1 hypothetical protein BXZ73DRAFT_98451 [Epithele typhae]